MRKSDLEGRMWRRRNVDPRLELAKLHSRDDLPPTGRVGDLADLTQIFTAKQGDEDLRNEDS